MLPIDGLLWVCFIIIFLSKFAYLSILCCPLRMYCSWRLSLDMNTLPSIITLSSEVLSLTLVQEMEICTRCCRRFLHPPITWFTAALGSIIHFLPFHPYHIPGPLRGTFMLYKATGVNSTNSKCLQRPLGPLKALHFVTRSMAVVVEQYSKGKGRPGNGVTEEATWLYKGIVIRAGRGEAWVVAPCNVFQLGEACVTLSSTARHKCDIETSTPATQQEPPSSAHNEIPLKPRSLGLRGSYYHFSQKIWACISPIICSGNPFFVLYIIVH